MNLLVMPYKWGPISDEQAHEMSEEKCEIFPCGICSNDQAKVFHNLFGQHCHRKAADLIPLIPKE